MKTLAAICLVLLAFGCGKEGLPDSARDLTAQSSASPQASAPSSTVAPVASAAPASAKPVTSAPATTAAPSTAAAESEANLQRALLTEAELPDGWTAEDSGSSDDSGTPEFEPCGKAPDERYAPDTSVETAFSREMTNILALGNEGYKTADLAKASGEETERILASCSEWTVEDEDGKYTFTATKASDFPQLGDQTLAYHLTVKFTAESDGQTFTGEGDGYLVGARVGRNVTSVFNIALGVFGPASADIEETETIARAAVKKLDATV